MKKYLWIGGCLDDVLKEEILKNNGKIMSSFISQMNIIEGIENNSDIIFDSLNSLRLRAYPQYKKIKIKKYVWHHKNGAIDISVPYLNIKYLAIFLKSITLKKEARKWAKRNKNNDVTVFVFGMHSPFMKAAVKVKKIIPSAKLVLINPDLPQFMDNSQSFIKKMLKKIDWKQIYKMFKKFDKHILYSKHMADFLKISETDWIVMEGSIKESDNLDLIKCANNEKIIVMYSGVIGTMYGILNLIEAVQKLGKDYELWLFGTGNLEEKVKKVANEDSNIKYFGYCSDRKTLLQYQKNATMLITLINPDEPVSSYCFPSKIFEYMISGNPVISTKINGIPDEYFHHLIPIENTSVDSIAEAIKLIGDMSEEQRVKIGENGKKFIIENKNINVQMKKVLDFIGYEKN